MKTKKHQLGFLLNPFRFGSPPAPTEVDPYWEYVISLLHFDGAHDSLVFTDQIVDPTYAFDTYGSGAKLTTAVKQFGTASLAVSGGAFIANDNPKFNVETGDFCVELSARPTGFANSQILVNKQYSTNSGYPYQIYITSSAGVVARSYNASSAELFSISSPNSVVTANQFNHFALSRQGSTFRLFVNGNLVGSGIYSGSLPAPSEGIVIGSYSGGSSPYGLNGQIDEFRFTKGVARYIENFAPPTKAFPNTGP